jgi:hypothetical protein
MTPEDETDALSRESADRKGSTDAPEVHRTFNDDRMYACNPDAH